MTDLERLYQVIDHTWPAARLWTEGGWTLRDGQGGGKRVSAATIAAPEADIAQAETSMRAMGQRPLFMIRSGDDPLDTELAARGYAIVDPVNLYVAPVAQLTDVPIPRVTAFDIWEPLAIMLEIWAKGGIGPERIKVMHRAKTKTAILTRWNEMPGGVAFAAIHDGVCMVHAVEVLEHQRQQGVAKWLMRRAAFWAERQGTDRLAVLCTKTNVGANCLYQSLGFAHVGDYHYRQSAD
ncbi:MAG: GNAT family N-acetyltransferase [Sulfitobacter sp.]|uniref:GNAT family N-acetyltransferase n=1 Tax=Sulfitobacter sp. TaxID=1903071 RepID=UPI004059C901